MKTYGIRCIYGCSESVQVREMCESEYVMRFHGKTPQLTQKSSHMLNTYTASLAKPFPKDFTFLSG